MEDLAQLARFIHAKNALEREISSVVDRPALIGHVGEYIAARVFGIELEHSAVNKGSDGCFKSGPLAHASVNIKWYAKQENILDVPLRPPPPHYYLVLAGPKKESASSRGTERPWLITSVYLFDSLELNAALERRGVKIGTATSVANTLWEEAEIYPRPRNPALPISSRQFSLLMLFG